MEVSLSNHLFEWILADWAGFGENPEVAFPSLRGMDPVELNDELQQTVRQLHPKYEAVSA